MFNVGKRIQIKEFSVDMLALRRVCVDDQWSFKIMPSYIAGFSKNAS